MIKLGAVFHGDGLCQPTHGDCKALHKAVLSDNERPCGPPVAEESDFIFPLHEYVVVAFARRVEPKLDVHEANFDRLAPKPKCECSLRRPWVDAHCGSHPRRREDMIAS